MPSNDAQGRSPRRVFLLVLTLATAGQVVAGATLLRPALEAAPVWFLLYWACSLAGVMTILIIAFLDMRSVRREHRLRRKELSQELGRILAEARKNKH